MTARKPATSTTRKPHATKNRTRHTKPNTRQKAVPTRTSARTTQTKRAPRKTQKPLLRAGDTSMQTFIFAIMVFFSMCALNLIGLTEYVEEPKTTTKMTYEVGNPEDFFNTLGPIAENYADYGLYPSVMLAQAALESHYGDSQLSYDYNNYFGIKAHDNHRSVKLSTRENYGNGDVIIDDNFCVYSSPQDCFKDYAKILTSNKHFAGVVGAKSPAAAARALQEGGYATDPNYATSLIQVINEYNLTRFDPIDRPTAKKAVDESTSADEIEVEATSTKEGDSE